jgi:hypothetical protein
LGEIITWQLRTDGQEKNLQGQSDKEIPKYLWATSSSKRRPGGPTAHLLNGELPLTFCTPVVDNFEFNGNLVNEISPVLPAPPATTHDKCGQPCFVDPRSPTTFLIEGCPHLFREGLALLRGYIGIAEGILKPWIISQLRKQIVIGAAGGQFASSPKTFKRYLEAASTQLGGCKNVLLWADAGAIANKNVMRQYRRTYELATRWGYTLRVA